MYNIFIKNLVVYGKHGVYEQEKNIAAPFLVNIECAIVTENRITNLEDTLNYEQVFLIVKEYFTTPYDLLETLAYDIATKIKLEFAIVQKIKISIAKTNPVIENMQGQVGITLEV